MKGYYDDGLNNQLCARIFFTTAISICGNGILENLENCDDGNTKSRDGCSELCMIE